MSREVIISTADIAADDVREAATWEWYYKDEIRARGLRRGDSLDTDSRTGEMVPAITNCFGRSERLPDGSRKLVIDEKLELTDGRQVVMPDGSAVTIRLPVEREPTPDPPREPDAAPARTRAGSR